MAKLKIILALLVGAGVLALGAGQSRHQPAAAAPDVADNNKQPVKKNAQPVPDPAKINPERRAAAARRKLTSPVTLEQGIEANTPLQDALRFLSDHFALEIVIDTPAFKEESQAAGEDDSSVELLPVTLRPMKGVPLSLALRLLLAQVKPHGATYLIQNGIIFVTTFKRSRPEDWTGADNSRLGVPAASVTLVETQLQAALKNLMDQTGINIVVDGRVAQKGETRITATLDNVPVDTAVRLLADMADLKVVAIDNLLYVTSRANAAALEAEQKKRREPAQPPMPVNDATAKEPIKLPAEASNPKQPSAAGGAPKK